MRLRDSEPGVSVLTVGCIVLFIISICGCTKIVSNYCQCRGKNIQIQGEGDGTSPWPFPGKFYGTVTNCITDAGIPGQRMYFDGPNNTYKDRNSDGYYVSVWMDPGTYTITAAASGYATKTANIYLPSNKQIPKNFCLNPLP